MQTPAARPSPQGDELGRPCRELLPCPTPFCPSTSSIVGVSRCVRSRLRKRRAVEVQVNAAISALNEIYGHGSLAAVGGALSLGQRMGIERVTKVFLILELLQTCCPRQPSKSCADHGLGTPMPTQDPT